MNQPLHWNDALIQAHQVFEDEAYAVLWLQTPNEALEGAAPRDMLDSDPGWLIVRRVLAAAEFGLPI